MVFEKLEKFQKKEKKSKTPRVIIFLCKKNLDRTADAGELLTTCTFD